MSKNDNDSVAQFMANLQYLLDSKKLLDDVLRYYNYSSGQFHEVPAYETGFRDCLNPTLQQKIKAYQGFGN